MSYHFIVGHVRIATCKKPQIKPDVSRSFCLLLRIEQSFYEKPLLEAGKLKKCGPRKGILTLFQNSSPYSMNIWQLLRYGGSFSTIQRNKRIVPNLPDCNPKAFFGGILSCIKYVYGYFIISRGFESALQFSDDHSYFSVSPVLPFSRIIVL